MFAPPNLFLCVWIPACAQTLVETAVSTSAVDGALCIQPSQTHAPILPLHVENFIASICLHFLDLSQRVSVYILDWSHFPSHFYRLEDTPMASSCTISPVFCTSLSLSLSLFLFFLHHLFANTISNTAEWHFRLIYHSIIITNRCKCVILCIEYCVFVMSHEMDACREFDLLYIFF